MSNLLKDASILLTPTGYDNGSMNADKPENGDGDFTFSRNSAATRVNAQGLVENVQIISPELVSNGDFSQIGTEEVLNGNFSQEGSELITNGDFATDSNWVKGANTTISGGSMNFFNATSGSYQTGVTTSNIFYTVTYSISNYSAGTIGIILNGTPASNGTIRSSNGVFTEIIQAPSLSFGTVLFNAIGFTGSIDNVSVKEVGQNWDFGGDWTVGENKIIHPAGSSPEYATQDNVLTIGKYYTYSVELLTGNGSNFAQLYVEGVGAISTFANGAGVYTGSFTASGTNIQIRGVNAAIDVEVTNISVKEVGQDWTVTDSDANNYVEFGDGTARLKFLNTSPITTLKSTAQYVGGKKYKLIVDVKEVVSGSVKIDAAGVSQTYNSAGVQESIIQPTGTSFISFYRATADVDITLNSVSLKEITDDTDIPRINYSGFSYQDTLGSELIAGGDFSYDSGWSGQKTIANGQLTKNDTGLVYKAILDVSVKDYKVVVDVDTAGANLNMYLGGAQQSLSVGVNTIDMQSGGSNSFVGFNNGDGSVINSISVKEVTGQEVVPDSGCGSWLLEPQSTNLITYSEDFSQTTWLKQTAGTASAPIVTSNYAISPNGTLNADRVVFNLNGGTTVSDFSQLADGVISSIGDVTNSIWIKSNTASNYNMSFVDPNANYTSIVVTNEWKRFDVTSTTVSTSSALRLRLRGNESTSDYADVSIWGAQVESLPYATSYIPTNGATNTRLADVANNSGNASLINSTEGVLYAEIAALADDISGFRVLSISDGGSTNRIFIGYTSNNIYANVGAGTTIGSPYTPTNASNFHKVALKYENNNCKFFVDGSQIGSTTTSITIPSGMNSLQFDSGAGSSDFYGKGNCVAVFKEVLTDAELQCLTTV